MKLKYLGIFLLLATSAIASGTPTACEQIQHACGEAGFTRNLPAGRDLETQCFQPLIQGQVVPGVQVASDLVKKCQAEQSTQPKTNRRKRH